MRVNLYQAGCKKFPGVQSASSRGPGHLILGSVEAGLCAIEWCAPGVGHAWSGRRRRCPAMSLLFVNVVASFELLTVERGRAELRDSARAE